MTSNLLQCTICPKKPFFSDSSHLLTHVSSKGHLSWLHKLQIRSHQELTAAQDLALYNQWFQEHDVGRLLSERLYQKDNKKPVRRTNSRVKTESLSTASSYQAGFEDVEDCKRLLAPGAYEAPLPDIKPATAWRPMSMIQDSSFIDPNLTPVRRSSRPLRPMFTPSAFVSSTSSVPDSDDDCPAEPDIPDVKASPQLKGHIWPGMALFDSASAEMRRKRNQKKDGSILRGIQYAASLVQPTELVSSAAGIVLKERHMDDLETDSLVEGESELMRPTPRKSRQSSYRATHGAKRVGRKGIGKRGTRKPTRVYRTPTYKSRRNMLSSSVQPDTPSTLPTTIKSRKTYNQRIPMKISKRKDNNFIIHEDHPSSFGRDGSSEAMPNPFLDTTPNTSLQGVEQLHLPTLTGAWGGNVPDEVRSQTGTKTLRLNALSQAYISHGSPGRCPESVNRLKLVQNPLLANSIPSAAVASEERRSAYDLPYWATYHSTAAGNFESPQRSSHLFTNPLTVAMDQMHYNPPTPYRFAEQKSPSAPDTMSRHKQLLFAP